MGKRLTQDEVIFKFKQIHNDYYDYSLVNYQGDSKKIKIICPIHGVFEQQPGMHGRQKQGCPKCRNIKIGKSQKIGNKKFIERIENVFGKNMFNYSKVNYNNAHTPIILICIKCNSEETKAPSVWYKGFGCSKCTRNKVGKKCLTTTKFIEKAIKIHSNKYSYSKVNYINTWEKVEIICKKHGSFYQIPNTHLNSKSGCPKCQTSKGEEQIAIWLNQNEIPYKFQHKIKIDNSNHYYDFYLPQNNIIIEYNGLQHYEPIDFFGGQEGFEYTKQRDKIKEKYCLDNKINLIILSYKDDIEEVLKKKLKNNK